MGAIDLVGLLLLGELGVVFREESGWDVAYDQGEGEGRPVAFGWEWGWVAR